MRQWRTDDTSQWTTRFGDLSSGTKSFGSQTIGSGDGANYSRVTSASAGATTASVPDLANGTYNLPCVIMAMAGSGLPTDNWELNYLISVSSGVGTFLYPLQYSYSSYISQIITANPFSSIALTGSLYMPGWNGTTGGVGLLFGGNSISGSGGLFGDGRGFRGGATSQQGEGTANGQTYSASANGNGAGGGGDATNSGHVEGGNSGGGGNLGTGNGGNTRNTGVGGSGGSAVSSADGKSLFMGGASGGGGRGWNDGDASFGVNGAGIWITIARVQNWQGGIYLSGYNGNSNGSRAASGASAGGFWIGKGQTVNPSGSLNVNGATGGTCSGSFGGKGGDSGAGGLHIDYSGINNGGVNSRQDSIYNDYGAAALMAFL